MKHLMSALAVAAALTVPVSAQAQSQDDGWEYAEEPAQRLTVAAVRYEGGQMIVAQCREGALTLVIGGLPEGPDILHLNAVRADGRAAHQIWASVDDAGSYRSASPGREARFLRGGGIYTVRTAADATTAVRGSFDLPADASNLDRVLTACGWALEDDRDMLDEAVVTLERPNARSDRPTYRLPSVPEREVSCVVRDLRLQDCRADHPPSARTPNTRSLLRAVQGERAYVPLASDPASAEGKVFRVIASNQLLVVVNR